MRNPAASRAFANLVEGGEKESLNPRDWQAGTLEWLKQRRLIALGPDATELPCLICRTMHLIERSADGGKIIVCQSGPESVTSVRLAQWRCQWTQLGDYIASELGCNGSVRKLIAGRLTLLGFLGKAVTAFPIWLARGFSDPDERSLLLDKLQAGTPSAAGVVITASKLDPRLTLPHGSASIWLGDIFDPSPNDSPLMADEVWRRGGRSPVAVSKRGRPTKPGDPVKEFQARIKSGTAKKAFDEEIQAIRQWEEKRFGQTKAYGPKTIASRIRLHFRAWEKAGFPRTFQLSE